MVEVGGREVMGRSSQESALLYVFEAIDAHACGIDGDNGTKAEVVTQMGPTAREQWETENWLDRDWCR